MQLLVYPNPKQSIAKSAHMMTIHHLNYKLRAEL